VSRGFGAVVTTTVHRDWWKDFADLLPAGRAHRMRPCTARSNGLSLPCSTLFRIAGVRWAG